MGAPSTREREGKKHSPVRPEPPNETPEARHARLQEYNPLLDNHGLDKAEPLDEHSKKLAKDVDMTERDVYRLIARARGL
jgi:hypothetical protein